MPTYNNFTYSTYTIFSSTIVTITGYNGTDSIVTVPGTIDGGTVRQVYAKFSNNPNLTQLIISEGVTTLGSSMCMGCTNLTSVTLPSSLGTIETKCFYGCTNLTSIDIPLNVSSIVDYAFYGCSSLTRANFKGAPLTTLSLGVFENTAPDFKVTYTPEYATQWNTTAPNGVWRRMGDAEEGIPDQVYNVELFGTVSYTYNNFTYTIRDVDGTSCATITAYSGTETDVTVPDTIDGIVVDQILSDVFSGNTSLVNLIIPDSIINLCECACANCTNLVSVKLSTNLTTLSASVFEGCSKLSTIDIPEKITTIYDYAFSNCTNLVSVRLSTNLTTLSTYVFEGCSKLSTIDIPEKITTISDGAFYGCSSLTCANFKGLVPATFGGMVFDKTAPNFKITYISTYTSNWTSVAPDGIWSVVNNPAYKVELFGLIFYTYNFTYYNFTYYLRDVNGASCATITAYNGSYYDVIIPDNIDGCVVDQILANVFSGNSSLVKLTIPDSVINLGAELCMNCSNLTSVKLSTSLTVLKPSVFEGCSKLSTIDIPEKITTISDYTFYGCSSLTQANFKGKPPASFGEGVFDGANSNFKITYLPSFTTEWVAVAPTGVWTIVGNPDYKVELGEFVTIVSNDFSYYLRIINGTSFATIIRYNGSDTTVTIPGNIDGYVVDQVSSPTTAPVFPKAVGSNYSNIIKLIIPDSVIYLGSNICANCTSLVSVKLSINLTKLNLGSFVGTKLASIDIPEKITSLGDSVFLACGFLTRVNFKGKPPDTFGARVFAGTNPNLRITYLSTYASYWNAVAPNNLWTNANNPVYTIMEFTYPRVATPTSSVASDDYTSPQTIILSCSDVDAILYYTIDGTIPTTSSLVYTSPFVISEPTTVSVIAVKELHPNSYTLTIFVRFVVLDIPVLSHSSNSYSESFQLTISSQLLNFSYGGEGVCFTLDGSDPADFNNTFLHIYSQNTPIYIFKDLTIRAVRYANHKGQDYFSDEVTATYTFNNWNYQYVNLFGEYNNSQNLTSVLRIPNASKIKLYFIYIDIEKDYDYFNINTDTLSQWTGTFNNVMSAVKLGDSISLNITSDVGVVARGIQIGRIEWEGKPDLTYQLTGDLLKEYSIPLSGETEEYLLNSFFKIPQANSSLESGDYSYPFGSTISCPYLKAIIENSNYSYSYPRLYIYYSLNGTEPGTFRNRLSSGDVVTITNDTNLVVKLEFEILIGELYSTFYSLVEFRYKYIQLNSPIIIPSSNTFNEEIDVSITCDTPNANIYYTLDNSNPTVYSNLYTGSFHVDKHTVVKAMSSLFRLIETPPNVY